jgi:predicted nucleic acid-binding protein
MTVLVDTSILGRLANTNDPSYLLAGTAVLEMRRRKETLLTAAQNLIEFRNFATRPVTDNGLGLPVLEAQTKAEEFESLFTVVPDTPDIYPAWKSLASASAAMGKQVHDVRLIAICKVNNIGCVLTFNVRHFLRFAAYIPGLSIVSPTSVANPTE